MYSIRQSILTSRMIDISSQMNNKEARFMYEHGLLPIAWASLLLQGLNSTGPARNNAFRRKFNPRVRSLISQSRFTIYTRRNSQLVKTVAAVLSLLLRGDFREVYCLQCFLRAVATELVDDKTRKKKGINYAFANHGDFILYS